jgi:HSP20 family protein
MNRYSILNPTLGGLPWNSIGSLAGFREEMNGRLHGTEGARIPALDFYEEDEAFVLDCELPGMGCEQIAVSFQEGILSICGERKPPRDLAEVFRAERQFGMVERRITIPSAGDPARILATYVDGVLKVVLPKTESSKPRVIPVHVPETVDRSEAPPPLQRRCCSGGVAD